MSIVYRLVKFSIIVLATIHLIIGVWWLALFFVILLVTIWLALSKHKIAMGFRNRNWLAYTSLFTGVFVLGITLQTLFFGVYFIPSESMERTLQTGDRVWVNKLCYGPRLPANPYQIPWVNILFWLAKGKNADMERSWWPHTRLKGYTKPKVGDIIVFNPPQSNETFIKRSIAAPGDTVEIIQRQVFVNGRLQANSELVAYSYTVTHKVYTYPQRLMDSLGIASTCVYNSSNSVKIALTNYELNRVANAPQVISYKICNSVPDSLYRIYPKSKRGIWNVDNYGPYIIPYKGMQIKLDSVNKSNYQNLIQDHEGICNLKDDSVFTFSHNYYFMMGDNRHNSSDSRHFGPIPEKSIVGRATIKIFSKSNKDGRWGFSLPFSNL
jgi:signal peptidase I